MTLMQDIRSILREEIKLEKIREYGSWTIYRSAEKTERGYDLFVAVKDGCVPIEGIDLPDLIADIDEAER